MANIRSAYGAAVTEFLSNPPASGATIDVNVEAQQTIDGWETTDHNLSTQIGSFAAEVTIPDFDKTAGDWYVHVDDEGTVTVDQTAP